MDGGMFNPRDATWVRTNTLEECSIFIGDNYPIVQTMPPSVHDADSQPFMKNGCVFIAHRRIQLFNTPIHDLCRYSLDESPSWGPTLRSCDDMDSRCPLLWIAPSMKNTWDKNYEMDTYPGMYKPE